MTGIDKLAIGEQLPVFERKGTIEHWNRFAAVNDEFAAHHWDYAVAEEEGFDAPFAMAPLQLAFFHAMLRDWMGDDGRIVSVSAKLRGPFFKDQLLTASAKVTALNQQEDEMIVDLELGQIDETDRPIAIGSARVALTESR
ncbi:MAG: MaoC/PaaZ C-terminal domain-containing protein [Pseudomonadales bacterium]|nr:MaoC/PaaZ C-terminal domain-containing protein [Pseudomonadales bacterium]